MLVDDFLPVFDISDAVATIVQEDVEATWDALMEVDLIDVGRRRPLVAMLGALRGLPDIVSHFLHGEAPPQAPAHSVCATRPRSRRINAVGFCWGERPPDEIALGLVGKFWRPVIPLAKVSRDEFCDFSEPGYAKTVYSLPVRSLDEARTLLSGIMRTATPTIKRASGSGVIGRWAWARAPHILVSGLHDVTREIAARQP